MRTHDAFSNTSSDCSELRETRSSAVRQRRCGSSFSAILVTGVGLWSLTGCTNQVESDRDLTQLQLSGTTAPGDPRPGTPGPTADGGTSDNPSTSMASGYLSHSKSSVTPWCGVVLVGPSTALTAAHCVEDGAAGYLEVGFGAIGEGLAYGITAIRVHPLYQAQPELHDIAQLTLAAPVRGVRPVALATPTAAHEEVSVVSYVFVKAGDKGDRRVFQGISDSTPDGGLSAVFDGAETNCHGESGAGLFRLSGDSSSSELLGIGSSGTYDPPHPLYPACLGRLTFAPVAANLDLIGPQ